MQYTDLRQCYKEFWRRSSRQRCSLPLMRERLLSVMIRLQNIKVDVKKTPPELSEQFPYIRKLIDAYGIKRYELEMYEADDIIGTLAKEAASQEIDVIIVSGDRDLTQLATEQVTVYITKKGITEIEKKYPCLYRGKIRLNAIANH